MPNGDSLDLKSIWEDCPPEEMDLKTKCIKDSFITLSSAWSKLPCEKVSEKIIVLEDSHKSMKTIIKVVVVLWIVATTVLAIIFQ